MAVFYSNARDDEYHNILATNHIDVLLARTATVAKLLADNANLALRALGERMTRYASWLAIFLLVSGCSSLATRDDRQVAEAAGTFSLQRAIDPGKTPQELSEIDRVNLERSFGDVLSFCQERLSGYELQSRTQARRAFWLSMSGLIAGSVLAPGLTAASAQSNAAWISALSGWAGATNFAGQAYRTSGLSGTTIADTRNRIIDKVSSQIKIASNGDNTFDERKNALMQARAECILYQIAVPSIPASE
jgi:hypothetical protein